MQIYEKQIVHVQIEIDYPYPVAGRTASKSFFKYNISKQITCLPSKKCARNSLRKLSAILKQEFSPYSRSYFIVQSPKFSGGPTPAAHTRPAATRVLFRSKRENSGNAVASILAFLCSFQVFHSFLHCLSKVQS